MPFQFCFTFANFRKDFNMKHTTFRYKIFFRTKRKISNKTPSRLLGIEPGVGSSDEVSCRLLCWNFVHSGLFWPFGVFLTYSPPPFELIYTIWPFSMFWVSWLYRFFCSFWLFSLLASFDFRKFSIFWGISTLSLNFNFFGHLKPFGSFVAFWAF